MAAVLFINYVDRGALPTAAHLIQADLHLNEGQLGILLSAFFWSYATVQIPVGWLAERYGAHIVLAIGLAIWALATMLVSAAYSFVALVMLRLLLGLGESAAFPCSSKLLAMAVPVESAGTANGIVAFAYLLGPAVGTYLGGILIDEFGWRVSFLVFGGASLLWLIPWLRTHARQSARGRYQPQTPTLWAIFRQRGLWGSGLGHFSSNYVFYFMLSWLPFYLVRERGFSMTQMAQLAGGAYLVNALSAVCGGWAVDRFIARGGNADSAYKFVMGLAQLSAIACMLCMAIGPRPMAVACIFLYQGLCGAQSPGVFAIPQILAGPAAAGRWVGIQNTLGNLAGILAPALTGWTIQNTGHFTTAFVLAAAVSVVGFVGWVFLIPPLRPIQWDAQESDFSSIASTRPG